MPLRVMSSLWTTNALLGSGFGTTSIGQVSAPATQMPLSTRILATSMPMPGQPELKRSLLLIQRSPQPVLKNTASPSLMSSSDMPCAASAVSTCAGVISLPTSHACCGFTSIRWPRVKNGLTCSMPIFWSP